MKVIAISFFCLVMGMIVNGQSKSANTGIPGGQVVGQATGDLDKDSVNETVYIYDVVSPKDKLAVTRMLAVYKTVMGKQQLWYKTPIDSIENINFPMNREVNSLSIRRNCIVIEQQRFAGGRNSETSTHIFRFQNNGWYLIGSTVNAITNCYGATKYQINFSTGDVRIDFEPDGGCDDDPQPSTAKASHQSFKYVFKSLPRLDTLNMGENSFIVSGKQECYY